MPERVAFCAGKKKVEGPTGVVVAAYAWRHEERRVTWNYVRVVWGTKERDSWSGFSTAPSPWPTLGRMAFSSKSPTSSSTFSSLAQTYTP
jgi:hypothetical protein